MSEKWQYTINTFQQIFYLVIPKSLKTIVKKWRGFPKTFIKPTLNYAKKLGFSYYMTPISFLILFSSLPFFRYQYNCTGTFHKNPIFNLEPLKYNVSRFPYIAYRLSQILLYTIFPLQELSNGRKSEISLLSQIISKSKITNPSCKKTT